MGSPTKCTAIRGRIATGCGAAGAISVGPGGGLGGGFAGRGGLPGGSGVPCGFGREGSGSLLLSLLPGETTAGTTATLAGVTGLTAGRTTGRFLASLTADGLTEAVLPSRAGRTAATTVPPLPDSGARSAGDAASVVGASRTRRGRSPSQAAYAMSSRCSTSPMACTLLLCQLSVRRRRPPPRSSMRPLSVCSDSPRGAG